MNYETTFSICSALVVPGWALLVFAPRWSWSARLVCPVIIPGALGIAYLWLIATGMPRAEGGFGTLDGVARLFADRGLLLAGWIHYLAFDLFVGSWQVRDAKRMGVPHLAVVPCLVLTFLLGPIGLLAYLGLRATRRRLMLGADD